MKSIKLFLVWLQVEINAYAAKFSTSRFFVCRKAAGALHMAGEIIGLTISGYIAAYTIPGSIGVLANASNWSSTPLVIQSLGGLVIPIVMIAALIVMFLKSAGLD